MCLHDTYFVTEDGLTLVSHGDWVLLEHTM